ncbi:MAG: SIR2 family protein [Planctomycetota bacterium]
MSATQCETRFDDNQPAYISLSKIIAEKTSPILFWVGAGLSTPAGLPNWNQLANQLQESARRKAPTLAPQEKTKLLAILNVAELESDLWKKMGLLKDCLGSTSYRSAVRNSLSPAATAKVPSVYQELWRLNPSGILSLNLDRFASRSYNTSNAATRLTEFSGCKSNSYSSVLKSTAPFVCNLHGVEEDEQTWVMTQGDFITLQANQAYSTFISACFLSRSVVFVGISADDQAAGGFLQQLSCMQIDTGQHFWITHRNDEQANQWAEKSGVQRIYYEKDVNHPGLSHILSALQEAVSVDEKAPPVRPSLTDPVERDLPTPEVITQKTAEEIRQLLNNKASHILGQGTESSVREFDAFCEKYEEAIYRAWYVSTKSPNNSLFGNTVLDQAAKGAFGRVYRAIKPDGEQIAIKVLDQDVRRNPEMLQSFRRGVRSMQILSTHAIDGMVPYRNATEIPAIVSMDWIDGQNLTQAVESHLVKSWDDVISISLEIATIIRQSHSLPERVLHRDIRPANIMLDQSGEFRRTIGKVVVLDFDLSWHRDAFGASIQDFDSMNGYIAPEQVDAASKYSTRNALVDSFGMGMTMLFLRSAKDPLFGQQNHANWREYLAEHVGKHACNTWISLPRRFSRLIEWSAQNEQSNRIDMSRICGELERLLQAVRNPATIDSPELLAEEIAARSHLYDKYSWNRDGFEASVSLPSGVLLRITGCESEQTVRVDIKWTSSATETAKKIGKWIPNACNRALSALSKSGWTTRLINRDTSTANIEANAHVSQIRGRLDRYAKPMSDVIQAFQFV